MTGTREQVFGAECQEDILGADHPRNYLFWELEKRVFQWCTHQSDRLKSVCEAVRCPTTFQR